MNAHEERMCELQADVFERSVNRFPCGCGKFIERFMRSDIAKFLDDPRNEYNFLSIEEILISLEDAYPSLYVEAGAKIPLPVMRWIGYVYRCYCIRKKKPSLWLYKEMKVNKMLSLYDSFHTLDPDDCVDRIEEIIAARHPRTQTDYEIYRAVRLRTAQ